ncbi:MAG: hypothetical protein ACRD2Y_12610 [Terriglobales bacterium]
MSRAFRLFVISYAVVIAVAEAGFEHFEMSAHGSAWTLDFLMTLTPAASYVVLAVGFALSRERERAPGRLWLAIVFAGTAASTMVSVGAWWLDPAREEPIRLSSVLMILLVLAYLGFTAVFINRLGSQQSPVPSRNGSILRVASLVIGAVLVLSSLFLGITVGHETGWGVITMQESWVTAYYSVGKGVFWSEIRWLQPIFGPAGYAFYVAGLLGTLALVALQVKSLLSKEWMQASPLFARLTALIALASLWLITDIFWGWHFDYSGVPWVATMAFGCWLAAIIFGAVLLLPLTRGETAPWRLRALVVFQVPVGAFNMMMLPGYFGANSIAPFPGLALLIVGMQIETWACISLLVSRGKQVAQETAGMAPGTAC